MLGTDRRSVLQRQKGGRVWDINVTRINTHTDVYILYIYIYTHISNYAGLNIMEEAYNMSYVMHIYPFTYIAFTILLIVLI